MVRRRARPARILFVAIVVGFFGGLAGKAMDRNDAWPAWLGLELDGTASVAAGALLGALFGVFAELTGRGRARHHGHPDTGGGPGEGGGDGGGDGGGGGGD